MNIYLLLREFYIRQSVNPLSTGQIAMWHALVYQCNQLGWPSEFNMPNRTLETLTGLSRAGISKSRNVLKQSGLIDFRSNGTKASTYRVVDITTTSDSTQGSTQNSAQRSTQGSTQNSAQRSTQNSSTYLRLDKTKQDKTINAPLTPQGAGERVLSSADEFTTKIWPAYPRKGGNFMNAQKAYVQAVASGEVTADQVLAKIGEYKAYIALNNISTGYVMTGGNWFAGHGWKNEYDTKTPEKPANKQRFGKPQRHEATPEWMQEGYQTPKQEVSAEAKATLAEQLKELEQLRKGKDEDANTKTMA